MPTEILLADYHDPQHAADLAMLLNSYAMDPMANGEPLPEETLAKLAPTLAAHPAAFSLLAYTDGKPSGIANCFLGLSTFQCRPLVNIHDIAVHPDFRGHGVGRLLLEKVDEVARDKGCCKITLEVLSGNDRAKAVYEKAGFSAYELDPEKGQAQFWEKEL